MTIRRLLVANRGEIARRVFRTCHELDIETVAVFSDADEGLAFVAEADVAVRLEGTAAADTYLRGDLLVAAARDAEADAVHPGYGFLSESAGFARRVIEAGLTWVGPSPASIEQMGSKVLAKKLMASAGVPVLTEVDPSAMTQDDLPVLVKASAGGGGRGMRVVRDRNRLSSEMELASAEALSAFGDGEVFCERLLERARHVEVQVWGDHNANVSVLGERDCSVQRRHQKIIEEAPAPWLPEPVRKAIHDAARAAAEAIRYVGAGTVEFLYDGETGGFWFLEMNTRLQVEHPVTECVSGLDLVALQIRAAEGGGAHVFQVEPRGHAVEARLYAEDPARDWRPQSGRLTRLHIPASAHFEPASSAGIRVDSGYRSGDDVSTYYDPMLAKVVAWAPTRKEAVRRLAAALQRAEIHGVRTNRDLLVETLRHRAFRDEELSTDFLSRHRVPTTSPQSADVLDRAAFAAAVTVAERVRAERAVQRGVPVAWRNVASQPQLTRFAVRDGADPGDERVVEVHWATSREGYVSADLAASPDLSGTTSAIAVMVSDNSVKRRFEVYVEGDRVDVESSLGHVAFRLLPRFADPAGQVAAGSLLAPMPGTVVSVAVTRDEKVSAGQTLLVMEAMKMQHLVAAPHDGTVAELAVDAGDQVAAAEVLAVVQPTEAETGEPG